MRYPPPSWSNKKLYRSRNDRKIAGVCGGFAEYLEIDATLVRVLWLIMAFFVGWGFLGYLIAWIVMPDEPDFVPVAVPSAEPAPSP
jgi:phage shock protein C